MKYKLRNVNIKINFLHGFMDLAKNPVGRSSIATYCLTAFEFGKLDCVDRQLPFFKFYLIRSHSILLGPLCNCSLMNTIMFSLDERINMIKNLKKSVRQYYKINFLCMDLIHDLPGDICKLLIFNVL